MYSLVHCSVGPATDDIEKPRGMLSFLEKNSIVVKHDSCYAHVRGHLNESACITQSPNLVLPRVPT